MEDDSSDMWIDVDENLSFNDDVEVKLKNKMSKLQLCIKRLITRIAKIENKYIHKAHLICFITHFRLLIRYFLNDEVNLAIFLSLLPKELLDNININKFLFWFKNKFLKFSKHDNYQPFIILLFWYLKCLNIPCKILCSLQPWNPNIDMIKSRKRFSYKIKNDSKQDILQTLENCDPNTKVSVDSEKISKLGLKKIFNKKGLDYWLEVYYNDEWIPINSYNLSLSDIPSVNKNLSKPIQYIISFNSDEIFEDATEKYAESYYSETRILQIEKIFFRNFINFLNNGQKIDVDDISTFPSKVSEYKHHPKYVLRKDLLKNQVFYPDQPKWIGKINDYEIYSRDYIYTLQSEKHWLIKEGRIIKEGENPIKIMKKRFRQTEDTPLYGIWQTIRYKPPIVSNKDKIIPRNKYGNHELYKSWMLPKNCVHIKIDGLLPLAKKLNIDAVHAVVGWDFSYNMYPIKNGIITHKSNKKPLLVEYEKQQNQITLRNSKETEKINEIKSSLELKENDNLKKEMLLNVDDSNQDLEKNLQSK